MNNVIIFCPNPYSNYTISVIELLQRGGVEVSAVICRTLLNPSRLMHELKKNKITFLKKVYRKLILRSSENNANNSENIKTFMMQSNITGKSVLDLKRKYQFELIKVASFDNQLVLDILTKYKPKCCVFTGGGIVPQSVIEVSGMGVLNCHMGILPFYRGMDVVEWPILEKNFNNIGVTVHLMEKTIDTGAVIDTQYVSASNFKSIGALRNKIESLMPLFMVNCCIQLMTGKIIPKSQSINEGRLYFSIHKKMRGLINKYLQENAR